MNWINPLFMYNSNNWLSKVLDHQLIFYDWKVLNIRIANHFFEKKRSSIICMQAMQHVIKPGKIYSTKHINCLRPYTYATYTNTRRIKKCTLHAFVKSRAKLKMNHKSIT